MKPLVTRAVLFSVHPAATGQGAVVSGSLWTISLENVISVLLGDGVMRATRQGDGAGRNYKRHDKFRRLATLGPRLKRGPRLHHGSTTDVAAGEREQAEPRAKLKQGSPLMNYKNVV